MGGTTLVEAGERSYSSFKTLLCALVDVIALLLFHNFLHSTL